MELSKIQQSKMELLINDANFGYTKEQIIHSACNCQLCVNDVRPIPRPQSPRQIYPNQVLIPASENFLYLLKKLVNFRGIISIPQMIFLQDAIIFYSNEYGKLRIRDKISNQDGKKFFDDRRQKARMGNKNLQRQKDSYVLVYKSGNQQLMSEANYNKMLSKRKNDPFWTEVTYSYKMPQSKQLQPQIKTYCYKRTKSVVQRIVKIMQRVIKQVDSHEQKINKESQPLKNNYSMISVQPGIQNNSIMMKSLVSKNVSANVSQNFNPLQMFSSQNYMPQSIILSAIYKTQKSKIKGLFPNINAIIQEIVAYLQASSKIRILQLQIDYVEIDYQPTIIGIRKLIVCETPVQEQCYLHDRYKSLEPIGNKQLVQLKKLLDKKDEQALWNVCTDILQSCLEQRRIRLKIIDYKKPSKASLQQMFMKFFPEFSPALMFQNINWKNELPKFKQETGIKLKQTIESDQGISVLKRFNIIFFRTF